MKHRRCVVCSGAVAFVAAVALSGCGIIGSGAEQNPAAAAVATPAPSADATSGFGSVKDGGDLPDPCTLLSRAEVADRTGRPVTEVDEDEAEPGESTRYCQWQQDGGQLALFLSRTGYSDFKAQLADGETVNGVGDEAFVQADHLYVLYGTVQIDVYVHGGSEEQNLTDAKQVAKVVMPKI